MAEMLISTTNPSTDKFAVEETSVRISSGLGGGRTRYQVVVSRNTESGDVQVRYGSMIFYPEEIEAVVLMLIRARQIMAQPEWWLNHKQGSDLLSV